MSSESSTRVSVLLPVCNADRYLADALGSVLDQTMADFEVVAIDDGSTDRSRAILEDHAADGRVRVVSRANRGLIATLNEGLALCRGELIARMDADDICMPDRFERQAAYLDSNPDCVAVGSRAVMIDPQGMPIMVIHKAQTHDELVNEMLAGRGALCHPAVMMRRDDAVAIGGYDKRFIAAEDVDFFLRLGERGRLHNLTDVLVHYRMHLRSESMTRRRQQETNARAAVDEARRRMGLPAVEHPPIVEGGDVDISIADHHRRWALWAIKAGNLGTARRHAMAALRRAPLNLDSWRVLRWSIRGY